MAESTAERMEFRSELRQVLHLITHSLYSHKEVFLRELISNASDAIDKVRFNSLDNEALLENNKDWKIKLIVDRTAGTLTVADNGIGMSREAVIENLGTIAKSGTKAFLETLKKAEATTHPELIGQFGVGFYAAFMVADKVTVISRTPGAQAIRWTSDGQGEFTVEPAEKTGRGTDVILHLKEEEKEFLDEWRLRQVVKQFSDFIEHPVTMDVERTGEDQEKTLSEETLNSRKALWLRSKNDISQEEHDAFYRQISGDFEAPANVLHYVGEGALEFKALLYIPRHKTRELQFGDAKAGPRLYINRVQIMDHCEALLPAYLRFVKGVVDCADLPLNVSREILQNNPLLEKIQKILVKNILKALGEMQASEPELYGTVYGELGSILKEGLSRDWNHKEQIADLLLFESLKSEPGQPTTLAAYVEAMPSDQNDIYVLSGESRAALEHAPSLEVFRHRGWDALFLTDPIDEFVMPALTEYKSKHLKAADQTDLELPPEEQKQAEEAAEAYKPLFSFLKDKLGDVKSVRLSKRLKESASCLVTEEGGMGANLERLMKKLGRDEGLEPNQRILELNPAHPVIQGLQKLHHQNPEDPRLETFSRLLYEEAVLTEGSRLADPSAFIRRINDLIAKNL